MHLHFLRLSLSLCLSVVYIFSSFSGTHSKLSSEGYMSHPCRNPGSFCVTHLGPLLLGQKYHLDSKNMLSQLFLSIINPSQKKNMSKTKLNTHCDSLGKKKSYFGLVLSVLTRAVISVIPKHWSPLERF